MNTDAIKIKYGQNEYLTTEDFMDDGLILEESLCSESQIAFGSCESAAVEVRIASTAASFVGKVLDVYLGTVLIGKYKAVSDERGSDGETRIIKAYDSLYEVNVQDVAGWYNNIDWDVIKTLEQFRNSFFEYIGISQVSTRLPNDDMAVTKTADMTSCSGATVLRAICEINGVFGHINANGHFVYIALPPSISVPKGVDEDEVLDTAAEDFTVPAFDSVLIRTEEGDVGGQYPASGGDNQYIITGNFLCYGKTGAELATIAQNALGKIADRPYTPYSADLECQGNLSLGTMISIPAEPDNIASYILQRRYVGFEALEEYWSAQGTPEYTPDINSSRNQLIATQQRVNKLTSTLEGTISEVKNIQADYVSTSVLEQTDKKFTAQFEEIDKELQQITEELDGNINFYNVSEDLSDRAAHPIERTYPSYDWTYNVICGVSVCSEDTKFEYTPEGLRKNLRSLAFNEETSESYRFVKENDEFLWKTVSDTDFGVAMSRIASLEVESSQIKTEVASQSAEISAQGVQIVNNEARITQTNSAITNEVKRATGAENVINGKLELKVDTDDNDQIVSMLNASADLISLSGNRVVINSDKFSLAADGTIRATNADVSGTITSNNAHITGGQLSVGDNFAVGTDGILRASGAVIEGTITSDDAKITGGELNVNNNFVVDSFGYLTAKGAEISGDITSSNAIISGGSINVNTSVNRQNAKYMVLKNSYTLGGSRHTDVAELGPYALNLYSLNSSNVKTEFLSADAATNVFAVNAGDVSIRSTSGTPHSFTMTQEGGVQVDGQALVTADHFAWNHINLSLASGQTKTLNVAGYKTLVLTGQVYGGSARQSVTIPIEHISSSNTTYQIVSVNSSALAQLNARLSLSGSTLTIYASGSNLGSGAMWLFADLQK